MSYKLVTRPSLDSRQQAKRSPLALWRRRGIAALRILFGGIWALNAWFAWQFSSVNTFAGCLAHPTSHQAPLIAGWTLFCMRVVNPQPHFFVYLIAMGETLIALCLIFGVLNNLACGAGMLFSLLLWFTAEGLGKPYGLIGTDVGVMIVSVLLFMGLLLGGAGQTFGADRYLVRKLGRWSFLASGGVKQQLRARYAFERSVYVTK